MLASLNFLFLAAVRNSQLGLVSVLEHYNQLVEVETLPIAVKVCRIDHSLVMVEVSSGSVMGVASVHSLRHQR